ncbi:4-diphosphocytidyl-2-C-methyl-D-erythritol kinase [Saezia sanguinis]|uniref:4-diphosphocytidyl-2-C-methyl-D-erythritol kinase n=1 Tax=Saezia sanguinis TaxID=1965230 RepID=A0A433SDN7_9BURK|nr:4-(cytidine 5'-diphospho)-2-C-methyl-D-erythritol kinase [Saezia sanguinis]RUS66847.1 4-diphosphocytidyl-2-C-methyl-D-erythritol kinase [Saezia sanguinis]
MQPHALHDVLAPAKLNLFLHITGRRHDGYHLLQSAFVAIDWFDTLHFERRNDAVITRHDLGAALPEDDLIIRAARLLQQNSRTAYGADISIQKNIPAQAGLGGGSSDAATTLLALNHLWQTRLTALQLHALAQQLGADVPFFLHRGPAWVEGVGEQISDLALPHTAFHTPIAVLKPEFGVSTQQLFSSPVLTRNTKPVRMADFASFDLCSKRFENESEIQQHALLKTGAENPYAVFDFGHNDLQQVAVAFQPQIGQALEYLSDLSGGPARMTGSGSAVFAAMRKSVDPLEQSTNSLPFGWQFKMCKILDEHPHPDWLPD